MTPTPPKIRWRRLACGGLALLFLSAGCSSSPPPMTTSDPPAKLRLDRLLEFYRSHIRDKKTPPADEKALKEYIRGLPADQKQGFGMTENPDDLFVNPRDTKPYVVRYKLKLDPGGASEAVAWEETSQNGSRFVAMTTGYVQECDDAMFAELKKQ